MLVHTCSFMLVVRLCSLLIRTCAFVFICLCLFMLVRDYCHLGKNIVFPLELRWSATTEVYPEPDEFKPQRRMDDQGRLRNHLAFFVYGLGRRVCQGQHVANRSVFIKPLLIFWTFKLSLDPAKPQDDMGFSKVMIPNVPCSIKFQTSIPEGELRRMMQIILRLDKKP
ncbi:hypothetical protein BDR07DRAFT_1397072 [Suillus spraguei]|nr:hypothetical protein BDR07DRAFT_1397072 [Suillus spraguei]